MVIYNVTVNIDDDIHLEWVQWMKETHIPEVMQTGMFLENRLCKLLVNEESGTTYTIQYTAYSLADLHEYQEIFAPELQRKHREKFGNKFVAFRTVMEII